MKEGAFGSIRTCPFCAIITRSVKEFEKEGMLSRRLDPQDNRYTLVSLTTYGQQIVATLSEEHRLFQAQLLSGITKEEQEVMVRTLKSLRKLGDEVDDKIATHRHGANVCTSG
jgi:DNA-binding MarR family transcriptional regulator